MNSPGRSISYESDNDIRNMSSSGGGGADKLRDNDMRGNLCDYSDEDDERLDIDDDSSGPPMGSMLRRPGGGSSDRQAEGNQPLQSNS